MHLPSVSFGHMDSALLPPLDTKLLRTSRRMVALLREGSRTESHLARKSWSLDFMRSPFRFIPLEDAPELKQIDFLRNQFSNQKERFESSARVEPLERNPQSFCPTSLAFRSIGYKSVPIPGMRALGIEFDKKRGIVPNDYYGRITQPGKLGGTDGSESSSVLPGLYSAGWVKRGPAGVIANTMEDAFATAEAIASDWENNKLFLAGRGGWDALSGEARKQGLRPVSWSDWQEIDVAEKARGKLEGKEREKFTRVEDMLSVLD